MRLAFKIFGTIILLFNITAVIINTTFSMSAALGCSTAFILAFMLGWID